jgi:deazaflavin-dependent oxidoreductase (nitroreductase family)
MPYQRALPYVDPKAHQSPPRQAALRLMSAPAAVTLEGTLPFRLLVWRLTPILMRLTGGRLARLFPMPTGVIDTRNARTGDRHRRCVLYFHDSERITVIPTKGGLPSDPFWYENALADPDVLFESQPFQAQPVEDEAELRRLWAIADRFFPPCVTYRQRAARTGRTIPILQLHPA